VKSEHISFINSQGLQLDALLDRPEAPGVRAWVIFAHCFTCNKNFKAAAYVSQALTGYGLGVLRFDFTGLGQSQGAFEETNFSSNVTDILSAAQYLSAAGQAPRLLVGHSLGGTAALYAAGQVASVSAVATIGSPAEPRHLMRHLDGAKEIIEKKGQAQIMVDGRRFTVKKQFFQDLEQTSLAERIGRLGKALLIMHAPQDGTVGIENAAAIFKAARHPKSFVALDGADHLLSDKQDAAYAGHLIAVWAGKYLP
jgi:pimeloyl-ACP methyl ester carboxylesterase